jgi:uncharacterized protein
VSPPRVNCPTCHRELDWANAPFRPFCSERCRLIDLGAWFSGQHAIAGDAAPETEDGTPATPAPADDS